MPTKLSNVRRRALLSALGIGLIASETSAFDAPVASSSDPAASQTAQPATTKPVTRPSPKDPAIRRTSSAADGAPLGVSSVQSLGIAASTPQASYQGSGPSAQFGSGMATGSGSGTGSYPGYGQMGESGTTPPGSTGTGGTAPGSIGPGTGADTSSAAPAANPFGGEGGGIAEGGLATGGSSSNLLPNVIGDMGPGVRTSATSPTSPTSPGNPGTPTNVPARNNSSSYIRVFKISENQSARPQDRIFFTFNYFNNVDRAINNLNNSPITGINVYRYVWGFEKTFDEGRGSIGLSLPLYSQFGNPAANSGVTTKGGTALGDLNIFAKYILKENKETGSLLSTGLLLTPPTGTRTVGGANYFPPKKFPGSFSPVHDLQIQPFLGYIFQRDRFFIQGFSALNVPVSPEDVTFWFNDVQFGYFLFRDRESDRFLSAIIPTFEAHISNPLNHRGITSPDPYKKFQYDPYGTPDTVNLTYGINFEIRRNSLLTLAFAEPVTAYKPFAYEAFVLFNYRFGRSRALANPVVVAGG